MAVGAGAQEWVNIRADQDATTQLYNKAQIAINPIDPANRLAYRKAAPVNRCPKRHGWVACRGRLGGDRRRTIDLREPESDNLLV